MPRDGTDHTPSARRPSFTEEALPHRGSLLARARRLTRDAEEAEDLVQEALLRAYVAFDGFRAGSNAGAWLNRILTNAFINRYRRRRREQAARQTGLLDHLYCPGRLAAARDPERRYLERAAAPRIARAVGGLPEHYREAMLLADVMDYSYREIAETLDCPVGTVMSRVSRGRSLLRTRLQDELEAAA